MTDAANFGRREQLTDRVRSGADWFFWIAGLSLLNSLAAVAHLGFSFVVGLGATQFVDSLAGSGRGGAASAVGFALNLLVAGVVVGFGVCARMGYRWVFLTGMVLYALDGMLFWTAGAWLGLGFHVFVLALLYQGFAALLALERLDAADSPPPTAPAA